MTTGFIYSPRFLDHETGRHPESPRRLEAILRTVEGDPALWERLMRVEPVPASEGHILRCHSSELIDFVRRAGDEGRNRLDPDTVIGSESFEVALLAVGASLAAVDLVVGRAADNAFVALRPPGHHARPTAAMGFCLFNNAAIAARYAQIRHGVETVLIVDWDVHHGNGTQEIFYRDPSVFYFSTHQYPYYPGTGAADETGAGAGTGFVLNVPLAAATPAAVHRKAFSEGLKTIEQRFEPDLIILSAGFDSRIDDPLGGLLLSDTDFAEMTSEVVEIAGRCCSNRLIALLEGGYNLDNLGGSVHAHLKTLAG